MHFGPYSATYTDSTPPTGSILHSTLPGATIPFLIPLHAVRCHSIEAITILHSISTLSRITAGDLPALRLGISTVQTGFWKATTMLRTYGSSYAGAGTSSHAACALLPAAPPLPPRARAAAAALPAPAPPSYTAFTAFMLTAGSARVATAGFHYALLHLPYLPWFLLSAAGSSANACSPASAFLLPVPALVAALTFAFLPCAACAALSMLPAGLPFCLFGTRTLYNANAQRRARAVHCTPPGCLLHATRVAAAPAMPQVGSLHACAMPLPGLGSRLLCLPPQNRFMAARGSYALRLPAPAVYSRMVLLRAIANFYVATACFAATLPRLRLYSPSRDCCA